MNSYSQKSNKINDTLSQEKFLEQVGVQKSFLKFNNFGSSIYEYLEISMPFMIIYESVDTEEDKAITFEFTESSKNSIYANHSASLGMLGERPLHSHDFYELTIVLSGEVTIQIEDEFMTYTAGDCCLCNKKILHRELQSQNFEILLFMFKEEYILNLIEEDILYDDFGNPYTTENVFHEFFSKNEKVNLATAKEYMDFRLKNEFDQSLFLSILDLLLKELIEKNSGRSYLIKGYFCRFLALLSDTTIYQVDRHKNKLKKEEELVYDISLILEQFKGQISNEELAKQLNYNSQYLNRVVKKRIGKSLSEYKRDFLLKEACYLLTNTDMKINEICESLGYTNRNFFNKVFEKKYGLLPSKFRATHFSNL